MMVITSIIYQPYILERLYYVSIHHGYPTGNDQALVYNDMLNKNLWAISFSSDCF